MAMTIGNNGYGGYEMSRGGESRQIFRRSDNTYEVRLDFDSLISIFESKDFEEVIDWIMDEI